MSRDSVLSPGVRKRIESSVPGTPLPGRRRIGAGPVPLW